MKLKSLASSSSLNALDSEHIKEACTKDIQVLGQTKGSIGPGGEIRLFDAVIEDEGVMKIRAALTEEELMALTDENMPLRHFRAEKVRSTFL